MAGIIRNKIEALDKLTLEVLANDQPTKNPDA